MLRDGGEALRVEAASVSAGSGLAGEPVGKLRAEQVPGLSILALRSLDGEWQYAPADEAILEPGIKVVFVAPPATRRALELLLGD